LFLKENWHLIYRIESTSSLSAHGTYLKGAILSSNNRELLKQRRANYDKDPPCILERWSSQT